MSKKFTTLITSVRPILLTLFALFSLSTLITAATVNTIPAEVPKGAYVNGVDGDQQFFQTLKLTLADDGAGTWVAGNDIVITLPTDIRVGDADGDGTYDDEISLSVTSGAALGVTVNAAAAGSITLDLATANNVAVGDIIWVIFPITTEASPAGATADYTITYGTDAPEAEDTETVTFADNLSLITFASDYSGVDQSSLKGDVYPNAAAAVTAAMTDFVPEQSALAVDAFVNGSSNWDGATLDGTEDGDEVTYYLWASQTPLLKKVDEQYGHRVIDVGDGQPVDADNEGGTFPATQLDGKLLAEGHWFFYVTSSLSGDWVLGSSDSVEIRHQPVFAATEAGAGLDYDGDDLWEHGVGNDDDVTAMYLESGGTLGRDGAVGSTNTDHVKIFFSVEDVDDSADVQIFLSTNSSLADTDIQLSGTSPDLSVTGLTDGRKINTDLLYDEGASNYIDYDIFTSNSVYEPAGDYYIYIIANDGKHQTLKKAVNNAGTAITLFIKHYPYLSFQDHYGAVKAINTANEQFVVINWGETVDGDKDADGTATIKLYASDMAYAVAAADPKDPSVLEADVTADPTHTVLITTINDSSDSRDANRYMWDIKNSGLAAGSYFIYGHIYEGGDNLVVQWTSTGAIAPGVNADDRSITLTHGSYFLPKGPVEGEIVSLKAGDSYDLRWDAYDMDATVTNIATHAFVSKTDGLTADFQTIDAANTADYFVLTSTTGEAFNSAASNAASYFNHQVSSLTTDMSGAANTPDGNYYVYFYYSVDGTFDTETPVQADGMLNFDGNSTNLNNNYNFTLQPTLSVLEKGDTIRISLYAKDPGTDPTTIATYLNVPATFFDVIDQDNSTAGVQPFSGESVNFNGTVIENSATLVGSLHQLNYVEYSTAADALDTPLAIASFQLVVKQNTSSAVLTDNIFKFSSTSPRNTHMVSLSGGTIGTNVPVDAANIMLAPRGKLTGFVDIEARSDSSQVVDVFLCPTGSYNCISDSEFLSANTDTDASDGIQVTLGANGSYTLNGIPNGAYDIVVQKAGWLTQRQTNQNIQLYSTTSVNFTNSDKLLAGDCTGFDHDGDGGATTVAIPDNQITSNDIDAVSAAFNTVSSDSAWNGYCDFDADDKIYVSDLNYAVTNFNGTGQNGEGLLYKSGQEMSNPAAALIVKNEDGALVEFSLTAENIAGLHAYAVPIHINSNEWEFVSHSDGLSAEYSSYALLKEKNNSFTFASAIMGADYIQKDDVTLLQITLRKKVADAAAPTLGDLTLVNYNHRVLTVTPGGEVDVLPTQFSLSNNYPNPFNPVTTIDFSVAQQSKVQLVIFNILGQKVKTIVSKKMDAGIYQVKWNGINDNGARVASGVYMYRLMADEKIISTKKMMMIK